MRTTRLSLTVTQPAAAAPRVVALAAGRTNPATAVLWERYFALHSIADRNELVTLHIPLVWGIARKVRKRLVRSVVLDDLFSAGAEGLIEAVEHFDPSRRTAFTSYATQIVWGRMYDWVRNNQPMPRGLRQRIKQLEAASSLHFAETGNRPNAAELATRLSVTVAWVEKVESKSREYFTYSMSEPGDERDFHQIVQHQEPDPADAAAHQDLRAKLVGSLFDPHAAVVDAVFFEGQTYAEASKRIDKGTSRAQQLGREAFSLLTNAHENLEQMLCA